MTSTTADGAFAARSWPIRLLRAFAATAVSVILAVVGHRLGGGEIVSPALLVVVLVGVLTLSYAVSGRRVTTGQILGLLLLGQITVHAACMTGGESMALGPTMLLGHLAATALSAAVLRRGESFLWSVAERVGLERLQLLLRRTALPDTSVARHRAYDIDLPRLNPRAGGVVLRGPPVSCA